jgi:hypothetical protein
MQRFLNSFIFTDAVHVSGGFSAHHQEHITVHTAQVMSTVMTEINMLLINLYKKISG